MQSLVIYLFCDYMYKVQNIKKKKSLERILYMWICLLILSPFNLKKYIFTKKKLT